MSLNFNQFAAEANAFLKNYTKEMDLGNDKEKAGRILSSILHALRDVISTQESLQLIAQFPMFLKAVYVNGWTSHKKEKIKTMTAFIDVIRKYDGITSINDFASDELAENYIDTTFLLLRKYISRGELDDLRTELPKNLKSMIYQNITF